MASVSHSNTIIDTFVDKRHGGPYDRGSADRYYQRPFTPHYYEGDTYWSPAITKERMTKRQILEYTIGYNQEEDRKLWG